MNLSDIKSQMHHTLHRDPLDGRWVFEIFWRGQSERHDLCHGVADDHHLSEKEALEWVEFSKSRIAVAIQLEANTIKLVTRCGCEKFIKWPGCDDRRDLLIPLMRRGKVVIQNGDEMTIANAVEACGETRRFVFDYRHTGAHNLVRIFYEED